MSIAKRITLILAIALATLLVVAGNSLFGLGQANKRFEIVAGDTIPSIRVLYDINQAAQTVRAAGRDFALAENGAARVRYQKQIEDASQALEQGITRYEKDLVSDTQDKEMTSADRAAWTRVSAAMKTLMEKARAKDDMEVHALLAPTGEFTVAMQEMLGHIETQMDYNWKFFDRLYGANQSEFTHAKWVQLGVFAAAALLLAFMGWRIVREISSRLSRLATFMGDVSNTLNFTQRIRITRFDELGRTGDAFNKLLDKMQENLKTIADAAQSVSGSANVMASTSSQVAHASHQQSESASAMAATVEEMTVSVNHVADRATETSRLVTDAGELSHAGEAVIGKVTEEINAISTSVGEAEEQIRALETHSQDIASVVQVIKDVADQTNLLALNAAIEAARAGEQGRGFAVVADEVRKLAERTSSSTQQITNTVEAMRTSARNAVGAMQGVVIKVGEGVTSAQEANTSIGRIGTSSREAVGMVSEIATAIREQGAATNNIAQQVEQIAQMSEESSAAATNTAEVAGQLNSLAARMQEIIGNYTLNSEALTIR